MAGDATLGSSVARPLRRTLWTRNALPRYTIVDNFSPLGKRRQRAGRVPDVDDLQLLLAACDGIHDFDEILGGPCRRSEPPLDTRPLATKLEAAMRGSAVFVIAYEDEFSFMAGINFDNNAGKIVGIGRVVSDGSLVATVHDVLVHPDYRRQGIGRRILQLLCRYMDSNLDVIDVGTTCFRQETKDFLTKAGFGDDDEGSTCMVYGVHRK